MLTSLHELIFHWITVHNNVSVNHMPDLLKEMAMLQLHGHIPGR